MQILRQLLVFGAAILRGAAAAIFVHKYQLNATEVAAWVQAVGAICALTVALWLHERTKHQQAEQASGAAVTFLIGVTFTLESFLEMCQKKNRQHAVAKRAALVEYQEIARSIPLQSVSLGMQMDLLDLRADLAELLNLLALPSQDAEQQLAGWKVAAEDSLKTFRGVAETWDSPKSWSVLHKQWPVLGS